ncbi:hypothetical protein PSEEN0867 [Pseudomonas entomophila L48]|uniref:Uncharacterized protein n=1 Tax=Pseudomonas entomophila (strain L48) TaxID=384676 RepID=Q1IEX7_PSEE4|nr:hypothetical protein PSEEN0867 [Pseudomonas entomophila L48]
MARSDLMSLRAVLVDFKVRGMPKDEMLECLENLRAAADENIILELMDFVEGYCIKDLSIY